MKIQVDLDVCNYILEVLENEHPKPVSKFINGVWIEFSVDDNSWQFKFSDASNSFVTRKIDLYTLDAVVLNSASTSQLEEKMKCFLSWNSNCQTIHDLILLKRLVE